MHLLRFAVATLLLAGACSKKHDGTKEYEDMKAKQQRDEIAPLLAKYKDTARPAAVAIETALDDDLHAPVVTEREPWTAGAMGSELDKGIVLGQPTNLDLDPAQTLNLTDWPLGEAMNVLHGKLYDPALSSPTSLDEQLARLGGKTWIAVVRVRKYTKPVVDGATFTGATASGDGIVYAISPFRRIGGFPWESRQRLDQIKVSDDNAVPELERSFREELVKTLEVEAKAYLMGQPGPADVKVEAPAAP